MTGYAIAMSPCFACRRVITYNPARVPSIRDERGVRQPVCADCVAEANPIRVANGLDPIVPSPDAYEACEEGELDG